jgi:uncharacterized protein YggU (UPF0235/DUF167 family)
MSDAAGAGAIDIGATASGSRLALRVMPRAPRAGLGGVRDGRLVIRVTAAPVDGAANDAVVDALARALRLPRAAFRIASGATSRNKTVEVAGLTPDAMRARLTPLVTP